MTLLPPVSGNFGFITVQAAFSPKYPSNSRFRAAFRPIPLVAVPIDLVQLQETL
jgi:hypothetical protein